MNLSLVWILSLQLECTERVDIIFSHADKDQTDLKGSCFAQKIVSKRVQNIKISTSLSLADLVEKEAIDQVDSFWTRRERGTEPNIRAVIAKARVAFKQKSKFRRAANILLQKISDPLTLISNQDFFMEARHGR